MLSALSNNMLTVHSGFICSRCVLNQSESWVRPLGRLALPEIKMSEPLSATELDDLTAALSHRSLPATAGPRSNLAYVSKEENDRLVRQAMVLGRGRFRVSEHDHRLALESSGRQGRSRA